MPGLKFAPPSKPLERDTEQFLCELIRYPSLPGKEAPSSRIRRAALCRSGRGRAHTLSNALREDEDYADPVRGLEYEGRSELRVRVPGAGGGRSLLFNTHLDVVPPSAGTAAPL